MTKPINDANGERFDALADLAGMPLTSVTFILNAYIALGFARQVGMTILVWPQIVRGETVIVFGDLSYVDEICTVLGRSVVSHAVDDDETFRLHFDDGTELRMVLRDAEDDGARVMVNGPGWWMSF